MGFTTLCVGGFMETAVKEALLEYWSAVGMRMAVQQNLFVEIVCAKWGLGCSREQDEVDIGGFVKFL